MNNRRLLIAGLIFLCSSCGVVLQNAGTKDFKDPVTKTSVYKSLNKFQQDFLYLKVICEKYFPLADRYFPEDKRREVEKGIFKKLERNGLSDLEFRLLLKNYLSHFDNQHTWISLKGISITGIYPFIPYNRDSSWYLMNAVSNIDHDFIGQKISAFNNVSINEYEEQLYKFVSAESNTTKRKEISSWWYRPTFHEFIASKKIDTIKLHFDNEKVLTIPKVTSGDLKWHLSEKDFKQHEITKPKDRIYDYQIIDSIGVTYFQFHECYDKIEIKEGIKSYVKPWLRPLANAYVNIQTSKKKPSKRLKKYFDPERPVFSAYVSQMISESNEKGIDKMILDLRNNNGGSETIGLQLLYYLTNRDDLKDFEVYIQNGDFYRHYFKDDYNEGIEKYFNANGMHPKRDTMFYAGCANGNGSLFDKITDPKSPYYIPKNRPIYKGKLVVIADFSTHSAGALFASLLQDNKIATVIGTELANNPTGPTTWTPFRLPNSKIDVSISSQYLIRPDKTKGDKFVPDFYVDKSLQDVMNGSDPLFDKALEILNKE